MFNYPDEEVILEPDVPSPNRKQGQLGFVPKLNEESMLPNVEIFLGHIHQPLLAQFSPLPQFFYHNVI